VRSDQLVTVLSAAIFVFVGVDCNHFRYVLDFEVNVQFHFMSVQYDKYIFIITHTMHTIGVDKITSFKTTLNNVLSPTCFDPYWIIIREVHTLFAKLLPRLINWKGDLVACQCCSG